MKYRKGKLNLPVLPSDWFKAILDHQDLEVLPLDIDVCVRSTPLPPVHNDPCDRMIIATAQGHQLPVVTADPVFKVYGIETLS